MQNKIFERCILYLKFDATIFRVAVLLFFNLKDNFQMKKMKLIFYFFYVDSIPFHVRLM